MAGLARRFFARDADVVARDLLGRVLVHDTPRGRIAARIVETEAYFGPPGRNPRLARRRDLPAALRRRLVEEGDPASHSFVGVTQRNAVMYGPPGHAYVYLIYGMHECMNVVTGRDGEPQAVLLRAGAPLEGLDLMQENRGRPLPPRQLASGPAKLARALGVSRALTGADLVGGAVRVERGRRAPVAGQGPRVGVVGGADLPLRFFVEGDPHVSRFTAGRARRPRAS